VTCGDWLVTASGVAEQFFKEAKQGFWIVFKNSAGRRFFWNESSNRMNRIVKKSITLLPTFCWKTL
jgi:hypothetical protein